MKVLRPVTFSRKCPWCRAVVVLENSEMNFKKTNARQCLNCKNTVFFTDSYGRLHEDVLVEYGLVPAIAPQKEDKKQGDLFS